jgi:very-short-patch-repair endonuclease
MTVVVMRDCPTQRHQIRRRALRGDLVRVLPGTYLPADTADHALWLAAAACARYPDAVITGPAARYLHTGGPPPTTIDVATQGTHRHTRGPYRFSRTRLPADAIHTTPHGIRVLTPTMSAVIDAAHDHGTHLYDALRTGHTTPDTLTHAWRTWRRRPGNTARQPWITAATHGAWSVLEAQVHQILHTAGIHGWHANTPIRTRAGHTVIADILFTTHKLIIEVDGFTYHHDHTSFHKDRYRHNHLVHTGYTVLHVTAAMLTDPHYLPHLIRDTLTNQARRITT